MKIRVVKTSAAKKTARWAILYADGTMVSNLNFARPRSNFEAGDDPAEEKAARMRDCRILKDVLMHFSEYKSLSALNYGVQSDRWDLFCDNMALWGSGSRKTEAFVSDTGKLCIYNPNLLTYINKAAQSSFPMQEHEESETNKLPLKFKVVKKRKTLREDLIYLWPDGSQQITGIDRGKHEGAKTLAAALKDYPHIEEYIPHNSKEISDTKWDTSMGMEAEYGCYTTVLAVTGNGKLVVSDNATMAALKNAVKDPPRITADKLRFLTPLQYTYLCYLAGIYDDKLTPAWVSAEAKKYGLYDADKQFRKKINSLRVRVTDIIRMTYEGKLLTGEGFPFVHDTEVVMNPDGKRDWKIPMWYPGEKEYDTLHGDGINPCVPPFPQPLHEKENYRPVILTEEILQEFNRYLQDNNSIQKKSGNQTSNTDKVGGFYSSAAHIYDQNIALITEINKLKNEQGLNPKSISEAMFEDHFGNRVSSTKKGREAQEYRFWKTVERRWGTGPERKALIGDAMSKNSNFDEISKELGFTPGYVYVGLKSLIDGKVARGRRFKVGDDAVSSCTPGVLQDYHEYSLIAPDAKRLMDVTRSGITSDINAAYAEESAKTGLSVERVKEIVRNLN